MTSAAPSTGSLSPVLASSAASSHAPPSSVAGSSPDLISVELSERRTGMSFQRTRMSADRTLMSVIRTSLSLISFGFSIYQFFDKLKQAAVIQAGGHAPAYFGRALVWLGIGMLVLGIGYHLAFMLGLRKTRREMTASRLIHGQSVFPPSLTLVTAVVLLVIGVAAIISMGASSVVLR